MKNILIADDNEQILDVLKEYALKKNYYVYTAQTGRETLEEFDWTNTVIPTVGL